MSKKNIGIFLIAALAFSANTFAGTINSKEQKMRNTVTGCISDIRTNGNNKMILDVIYGSFGGAYKYCNSAATQTRKAITPGYNQQEKWDAEFLDLYAEYDAIPNEDKNKPAALNLIKKIRVLTAPNKLDGRHAQSKLSVYRAMMQELDTLDALLPSIENK